MRSSSQHYAELCCFCYTIHSIYPPTVLHCHHSCWTAEKTKEHLLLIRASVDQHSPRPRAVDALELSPNRLQYFLSPGLGKSTIGSVWCNSLLTNDATEAQLSISTRVDPVNSASVGQHGSAMTRPQSNCVFAD